MKQNSIIYVLTGGFLKDGFVERHIRMIIWVVLLIFFLISNRYTCLQKLKEIDKLQQQLQDVRFEALSISSELIGNSRQSKIEELVEEEGIDLEGAKTPPYKLER
jgi:cell division protein FtsL